MAVVESRMFTPLLLALLSSPSHAASADRLAAKAERAYDAHDYEKALNKCLKALEKDPNHLQGASVCGATLLMVGTSVGDDEMASKGAEVLNLVAQADPKNKHVMFWAAVLQLNTPRLIPEPEVRCSAAAQANWDKAEAAFSQNDMRAAQGYYESATALCENPKLWTWYGDTFFAAGDYQGAIAAYDHALEIEPCYWAARRFKGDALVQQGQVPEGIRWTASAIACNPEYATAWSYLDPMLDPRVDAARGHRAPPVTPGVITLDEDARAPWRGDVATIYQAQMQMGLTTGVPVSRTQAVAAVLGHLRELDALDKPGMELWALLDQAEQAGQLEEALFILMLDETSVEDFLAYRDQNLDGLTDYVLTLLR